MDLSGACGETVMQNIPVVDLQAFREGGIAAVDQLALVEACEDHGFSAGKPRLATTRCKTYSRQPQTFLPCRERKKLPCTEMRKIHWVITTVNSPSSAAIRKKSSTSRQAATFPVTLKGIRAGQSSPIISGPRLPNFLPPLQDWLKSPCAWCLAAWAFPLKRLKIPARGFGPAHIVLRD